MGDGIGLVNSSELGRKTLLKNKSKKLGIAFFYDDNGIVDEYFFFLLKEISKFTIRNVFISNGPIAPAAADRLQSMDYEVIIRDNIGFDVWAYKTAIEYVGYDALEDFDEIMLFNHTFYGPIYPFEEMFEQMDAKECGFWGITAHKELDPNPFTGETGEGALPWHLNSHFIAVRRPLAASAEFRNYWQTMPMITSYNDSVLTHESRFTKHFQDLGYSCLVYDDDSKYSSKYPCFINVDETLENRCPILKRRIFFHDPVMHEAHAIDLPRALRIMRKTSDYDESLIWPNIIRTADLRTLNTTAALTAVLPNLRENHGVKRHNIQRVAVCVHVYYVDMMEEILELCRRVPGSFDFIATTDTEVKAKAIQKSCVREKRIKNVIIRVMPQNRGRDMSSLFITCRDLFLEDRYDLVCRLHTKKSPQVDTARSNIFKRHMFENLLSSEGYAENVLDMFEDSPWIGLAIPPAIHISYSALGMGWFANKPMAVEYGAKLGLKIKFDDHTPVAAYGTMFWFRPKALRKLFEYEWSYDQFNPEPDHIDGGLAHVLERLIAYVAQDEGYLVQQIMSADQASFSYAMLEFKYAELSTNVKSPFHHQVWMMRQWAAAGNALPGTSSDGRQLRDGFGFKALWYDDLTIAEPVSWEKAAPRIAKFPSGSVWKHALEGKGEVHAIVERYETFEQDTKTISEFLHKAGSVTWLNTRAASAEEAAKEYLLFGWAIGAEVFSLFDTQYYLRRYPDVAASNFNPFVHYIRHGAFEGRHPHPLFDPIYYANARGAGWKANGDPVLRFLEEGLADRTSPHPLFDMNYYYSTYPDIAQLGLNALAHYVRYGVSERRKPSILFDIDYYEAGLGAGLPVDMNPLVHYLEIGAREHIDVHPLFDGTYYAESLKGRLGEENPLVHYLTASASHKGKPHPLFDADWYREQCIKHGIVGTDLRDFLACDPDCQPSPHPMFDSQAYSKTYPEVRIAGMNPLVHYVKYGAWEKRAVPGFNEAKYARLAGLKKVENVNVFIHYLKHGQSLDIGLVRQSA